MRTNGRRIVQARCSGFFYRVSPGTLAKGVWPLDASACMISLFRFHHADRGIGGRVVGIGAHLIRVFA